SLRRHTISSISDAGIIETLISDTSLPENVTVEGITVDSRNNRVLAVIHAVKPLPPFNTLAAYDFKSGNRIFLSARSFARFADEDEQTRDMTEMLDVLK
ncbi:hypothetical protein RYX36_024504, partial [Vicia faba]